MDNEQLQAWVEALSRQWFARPFLHRASFNQRLTSTGGRYFPRTHNIEISLRQWEINGAEEVEKIIKHELCHYHLHILKKGYRHRDVDFRQLLSRVGGSRHCRPLPDAKPRRQEPIRYRLECMNRSCSMVYFRKRKVDVRKYACGRCQGKLRLIALQ